MKSFLIVGDLHLKNSKMSDDMFEYFFKWIKTVRKENEPIIQVGDLFDKSILPGPIIRKPMSVFKSLNDIIIVQGNHDSSKQMGSLLEPLKETRKSQGLVHVFNAV